MLQNAEIERFPLYGDGHFIKFCAKTQNYNNLPYIDKIKD